MSTTQRHNRKTHLFVCVSGEHRPGLLQMLSFVILDCGCSIQDSHLSVWGDSFSCALLINGNWSTLGKVEKALTEIAAEAELQLLSRHTSAPQLTSQTLPYSVDIIALEQPDIVHQVLTFFAARDIEVREMNTHAYTPSHSTTSLFTAHLAVEVPAGEHIASLRDDFLDLCDELNLDGVIEPIKP